MIDRLGLAYSIAELLPHGPSMVLLDELLDYGPDFVRCGLTLRETSRFCEPGRGVPSWVGTEYMAQAIGAYAGILRLQAGLPVQIALLLGTRSYACPRPYFTAGERLVVRAQMLLRDMAGVAAFACELGDGRQVWARSEIKCFEPPDVQTYLKGLTSGARQ